MSIFQKKCMGPKVFDFLKIIYYEKNCRGFFKKVFFIGRAVVYFLKKTLFCIEPPVDFFKKYFFKNILFVRPQRRII